MARAAAEQIKDVNVRYHDVAAADYDSKWGIDFGEKGRRQVLGKVRKALGGEPAAPFDSALEIGAGTGYFTINLVLAGMIREAVATDISHGMLAALSDTAESLGLQVRSVRTEAERLPFPEESFDLVFGHAVLHHLPDLEASFSEFLRVLRPGGNVVFCGEPSRYGDRLAAVPKGAALRAAPIWRTLMRAGARRNGHPESHDTGEHDLEGSVDVHAFTPAQLAGFARGAGFEDVRVTGEELAASWFGWANRTLESTAEPDEVPWAWRQYAYRGYLALQTLDRTLLEPRLPAALFYNLLMSARKPA
ncbi:MAG TPA: class I SAM-dependent methyltransferase [Thermoleophilaceae bacterium]|jgi:ubiquinone/menaquinone biosynthesis C-methylase UbiE